MGSVVSTGDLRTYVVNLRRRPDRRARVERLLPAELAPSFTSDWDGPFDGHELSLEDLEAIGYRLFPWQIRSDNPWWSRPLKYGEIGCTMAHLACWTDAAPHEEPYVLVLEDDIVITDDFLPRLLDWLTRIEAIRPFDLLYLGRYPLEPDNLVAPGLVVPGYSHCTFAYLLARRALGPLLETRLDQSIVPIDEFLPAMYHDHPRLDLRTRFPAQLRAVALDPPLVTQLPKEVAGSDTEDSTSVLAPTTDHQPGTG